VELHFSCSDSRGVVESTSGVGPVKFVLGNGEYIAAFESAVEGMEVNENREFEVGPEDAYGDRRGDLVTRLPRSALPGTVEKDSTVLLGRSNVPAVVRELDSSTAEIDLNHRLAGETLKFDVTALAVTKPSADDVNVVSFGQGYRIEEIEPGDGVNFPKDGDKLSIHYCGRLARDGTRFDSSRERSKPFDMTVGAGEVIRGWDDGVRKMSLGQRGILFIPYHRAYGNVMRGLITPNSDLKFDIEIIAINEKGQFLKSHFVECSPEILAIIEIPVVDQMRDFRAAFDRSVLFFVGNWRSFVNTSFPVAGLIKMAAAASASRSLDW
jgi:FK506-binding protein 1